MYGVPQRIFSWKKRGGLSPLMMTFQGLFLCTRTRSRELRGVEKMVENRIENKFEKLRSKNDEEYTYDPFLKLCRDE